ncbi:MAG: hypothetical protein JNL38_12950 [Myxococcales bacterium]|jgi:hypothetical protein|nr:hypothetical protein [Myxococcales bacterium]
MKRVAWGLVAVAVVGWASAAHADEYDEIGPLPPMQAAPAAASPPAPAAAAPSDAAAPDSVTLRTQVWYRGRVTEIVPGDHVTILLPTGESKRVAWAEIEKVVVSSQPAPPAAASPAGEPPLVGPLARVHLSSPRPATLYRRPRGSASWHLACHSPCDRALPLGDDYRVAVTGGSGIKEFRLNGAPNSVVTVDVSPPSVLGMVGGGAIAGTGLTGMYVGSLLTLIGLANTGTNCSGAYNRTQCQNNKDAGPAVRNVGLVTLGVSTLATLGGAWLFVASASTDVGQSSSSSNDAFLRSPEWRSASAAEVGASPAAATFPVVLTRSF